MQCYYNQGYNHLVRNRTYTPGRKVFRKEKERGYDNIKKSISLPDDRDMYFAYGAVYLMLFLNEFSNLFSKPKNKSVNQSAEIILRVNALRRCPAFSFIYSPDSFFNPFI